MALSLRRIQWPSDPRQLDRFDYNVFDGESVVGRIYLQEVPGDVKWFWTINGLAIQDDKFADGVERTLHDAEVALAAAWKRAEKR
jgi:hypothetical protein